MTLGAPSLEMDTAACIPLGIIAHTPIEPSVKGRQAFQTTSDGTLPTRSRSMGQYIVPQCLLAANHPYRHWGWARYKCTKHAYHRPYKLSTLRQEATVPALLLTPSR